MMNGNDTIHIYIVYHFYVFTIDMRLCLTISKGDFNFAGTKVITKWDTIFIKKINKTKPVFNKIPINMTVNKQE